MTTDADAHAADLRAVLVDDEPLAREELAYLLGELDGVSVVGQASDGVEALAAVKRLRPDVVFLDVQMPGLTGFQVARRVLDLGAAVEMVFVTAYDQRAIEAFDVNAVDYLLKPVDPARLELALQRVRRRIHEARGATPGEASLDMAQLDRIAELVADRRGRRDQLAIKVGERFLLVQADEIVHASVVDDTITVATDQHVGYSNYRTLDELHARLNPAVFWRVHRAHLVNINKIREIVPWVSRNYLLRMKDEKGTEIPVSRTQTRRLREYLKL
jgi:two-component system LytT family response regulator/two-component system response regulator LytT